MANQISGAKILKNLQNIKLSYLSCINMIKKTVFLLKKVQLLKVEPQLSVQILKQ